MLFDVSLLRFFLMSLWARKRKAKINKCGYIKSKTLYDEAINRRKRIPTKLEEIFANNLSDKRLIFKMHKELIQLNIKKKKD